MFIYTIPIVQKGQAEKYKTENFAYLLNAKGQPNVRIHDGNELEFKLVIKDAEFQMKARKSLDKQNLIKSLHSSMESAIELFEKDQKRLKESK